MPYIYLALAITTGLVHNLAGTVYNRKIEGYKAAVPIYNLMMILSITIGWAVLFCIDGEFSLAVLPYSIAFGVCFAMTAFGLINAYKHGSTALTGLILQLSIIAATIWGFFFWGAPVTFLSIIGIILVVISMVLCLYEKGAKNKKITPKWVFYTAMVFVCNAVCTILQKTEQLEFNGKYGPQFMFMATLISSVVHIVIYIRSDKSDNLKIIKKAWGYPVASGVCNVFMNLFIIILATSTLSPTVIYPTTGVAGIALITVFSALFLKEKIAPNQYAGIAVGAAAVLILSL